MLDKNIEKYVYINPNEFKAGTKQTAQGIWYSGEVVAYGKTHQEAINNLDILMNGVNKLCNKYNKEQTKNKKGVSSTPTSPKKPKEQVRM